MLNNSRKKCVQRPKQNKISLISYAGSNNCSSPCVRGGGMAQIVGRQTCSQATLDTTVFTCKFDVVETSVEKKLLYAFMRKCFLLLLFCFRK